jgi:hypothetical protein
MTIAGKELCFETTSIYKGVCEIQQIKEVGYLVLAASLPGEGKYPQ